jgi:hypothetical protein
MESNEIFLGQKEYDIIVQAYQDIHKQSPIFMSTFLESLGLSYRGRTKTLGVRFYVIDTQLFFLAKIQYGI